ncbi:MAG: hypothetical protein KF879_06725 [Saprospiraceae bacterium]|nr:hypothetical protein [Saprospiraceae bacterium]
MRQYLYPAHDLLFLQEGGSGMALRPGCLLTLIGIFFLGNFNRLRLLFRLKRLN